MEPNIVIFRNLSTSTEEIYNEFLAAGSEKFARHLQVHRKFQKFKDYTTMPGSAIFFLTSLKDIFLMEYFYWQLRSTDEAIHHFIYIPNLTFLKLESSEILSKCKYLDVFSQFLFQYAFFIIDEPESVVLSTIEWFGAGKCESHLTKVNVFDKKSMKWMKKLTNYEKFLEYNGCELTLAVTVAVDGILTDSSNYAIVLRGQTYFEVHGIVPQVFQIASKAFNFSVSYQPAVVENEFIHKPEMENVNLLSINNTSKTPSVYFRAVGSNYLLTHDRKKTFSHAFVDTSYRISVTPGELYTPYEKLFLPFDLTTWILLVVTFLIAFVTILVINRMPKSIQSIVYGHGVSTPFLNVVRIFFGMGMTQLPIKNFSRFILILFVFFCLIFRTCFQSKFYEFTTSTPRRPPLKFIDDLIERNYTIYMIEETEISDIFNNHERRPNTRLIESFDFYDKFLNQSQNSSAKLALLVDELIQNHIERSYLWKNDWNQLKETLLVTHELFVFHSGSFHFRMFEKLINRLIDTGVMKYLSDNYYTKKQKFILDKVGPEILSLDDVSVGFNIWLGFCGISFITFVGEFLFAIKKKKIRKIKFAKIHPQDNDESIYECVLKAETIEKFKVKKKILINQQTYGFQMEVAVEIHNLSENVQKNESEISKSNVKDFKIGTINSVLKSQLKTRKGFNHMQNFDEIEEFVD